MPTAQLSNEAI